MKNTLFAILLLLAVPFSYAGDSFHELDFKKADLDHDGYFDKKEFKTWREVLFNKIDADQDNSISYKEYMADRYIYGDDSVLDYRYRYWFEQVHKKKGKRFHKTDKNNDDFVSLEEFINDGYQLYNEADVNRDEKISLEEFMRKILYEQFE